MSTTAPGTLWFEANGMRTCALAWGPETGPLALCLHGYPDTARTWRHLGPRLAADGWRVLAPYLRGYAPSDLAPDGNYQIGALVRDALALRERFGDDRTALVGHDWGAAAVYALAAWRPERFARVVTLAIPPVRLPASAREAVAEVPLLARQMRMSWYMFFALLPGVSERSLSWLIPRLWAAWSPGYDAGADLAGVMNALSGPGRATAALRYYRALFLPWMRSPAYAAEQRWLFAGVRRPLLYLHGEADGCIHPALARRGARFLAAGSEFELVAGCGHFLHLERPDYVGQRIAAFLGPAGSGGDAGSDADADADPGDAP